MCKHDYGRNLLIKKALAACRAPFFFPLKIAEEGRVNKRRGKVVRVSLQIYEERDCNALDGQRKRAKKVKVAEQ